MDNKKIQLIIECNETKESIITQIGTLKYRLPTINSYVIEVFEGNLHKLQGIEGIKGVYENTHITAQMNTARRTVRVNAVFEQGFTGKGITIAFLDTGIAPVNDFTCPKNRIIAFKDFINGKSEPYDDNGHGTHVAGIACGNGTMSDKKYMGIAPECNIVAVKTLNEKGSGNSSDVLAGLQWIIDNAERYNIKIANLSIGTPEVSSSDPLVKAVEAAWDKGITITTAAGNNGPEKCSITSPGISRKVITVGASDDNVSVFISGNSLINFSGRGPTLECIKKPDVVAPGTGIISCYSPTPYMGEGAEDAIIISDGYAKLSGTSMSTPIVTGAVALLLQKYPDLKPDDIKYMLKFSTAKLNCPQDQQGWGLIDVEKLISKEAFHVR